MKFQVPVDSFIRTRSVTIAHCSKALEAVALIKQQTALCLGDARRCTRRQREHAIACAQAWIRVSQRETHQRGPHPTRPCLTAVKDHKLLAFAVDVQGHGHLQSPSAACVCH